MFKKLAQIANKLDGLGLTREADVLDLYLKKIAAGGPYAEMKGDAEALQAVNNLPYQSDIPAGLNVTTDLAEKKKVGPAPTSWKEYSARVGGTDGAHIQNLWKNYASVVGGSEEFPAFAYWWKEEKRKGSFPSGGGISETGNLLLKQREIARANPLYQHSEAVAEVPRFKGDENKWNSFNNSFNEKTQEDLAAANKLTGPAAPWKLPDVGTVPLRWDRPPSPPSGQIPQADRAEPKVKKN